MAGLCQLVSRVRRTSVATVTRWTHRHLTIVAVAAVVVLYALLGFSNEVWGDVEYGARGDDRHWKSSMATGTVALGFLAATLLWGAVRVLRGSRPRTHDPLRRRLGVQSAAWAAIHVVFGSTIHAEGWRVWQPFGFPWTRPDLSTKVLGVAVWIGLFALIGLAVLAFTSNASTMRRLGAARWKSLHRIVYVVFVLVSLHVTSIQLQERRSVVHALLIQAVVVLVAVTVARAFLRHRSSAPTTPSVDLAGGPPS